MFKLEVKKSYNDNSTVTVELKDKKTNWEALLCALEKIPNARVKLRSTDLPERVHEIKGLIDLVVSRSWSGDPEEMPERIGVLQELRLLNWTFMATKTIPHALLSLKHLTHLNLGHNELTTLPDDLWCLDKLTYLYLNSNRIAVIPDSYLAFRTLEHVCLDSNLLKEIPRQFVNCRHLSISFHNNPCTNRPS